jgi:antitoxin ParD1/3/4
MNVSLTDDLEAFVRGKVESGRYMSASEVVREALRLLEAKDRQQYLDDELALGFADAQAGRTVAWSPSLLEDLKRESEVRAAAGAPISDALIP